MFRAILGASGLCVSLLMVPILAARGATVELPIARPLAVAFSPDGKQVAVGGLEAMGNAPIDGLVILVDGRTGQQQSTLRHPGEIKYENGSSGSMNMIHELAYSPDGQTLAVAASLGLKLWNAKDGRELATLRGYGVVDPQERFKVPSVDVSSVAYSNDGKLLAIKYASKIELWDAQTRKPIREMESFGETHVAFFRDGSLLASAEYQNRVHVWDVASGKQLGEVHAQMGPLYGVAVSPDGALLAVVGEGGEKLWRIEKDAAGGRKFADEARLTGHFMSPVRGVAFSPDGRILATYGDNGALVIYDAQTRELVGTLLAGGPFAFSPDGKLLAVAQWLRYEMPNHSLGGKTRLYIWKLADVLDAGRLTEQARTAAKEMVQTLTTTRPDRRMVQSAVAVLSGPQGDAATPILADGLKNPLINEKQLLLLPLQRIARRDAKARAAIIEALRTAEAVDVRIMALSALSEHPGEVGDVEHPTDWSKEAVPALMEAALNDENPQVRAAAAGSLRRLDPAAYRKVAEKVRARGPVKMEVVRRDGKLFYQGRSLEEWIKRLSVSYIPNEIFGRPRPDEPLTAIRAIGADAVPVLVETLKSDQWPMRQAATAGLEALGEQSRSAVEPLLNVIAGAKVDDLATPGMAADAIAAILKGSKEPPDKLLTLLKSEDVGVRVTAARAIAQIQPGHPQAIQTLREAADGPYPDEMTYVHLYSAASEALQRLHLPVPPRRPQPPPKLPSQFRPPTVESLRRTIADPKSTGSSLVSAAGTLQLMGEKGLPALPTLLEAVAREQDRGVSRHLEMAIQRLAPEAVPAVSDSLKNASSDETRRRLISTLSGMGTEGQRALQVLLKNNPALGRVLSESMPQSSHDVAQLKDQAERGQFAATLGRANRLGTDGVNELMKVATMFQGEQTPGPIDAAVLGDLRLVAGDFGRAERAFRSAITRGETRTFIYKGLGLSLLAEGKKGEAKMAFEQVLHNHRQDDGTFNLKGVGPDEMTAAYFLDLITEERYAEHLAHDQRFACFPWFYVGQRSEIEGNREAAISAYHRCVELGEDGTAHPVRSLARWRVAKLRDGRIVGSGAVKPTPDQPNSTKRHARIATTPHFDVHLQSKDVEIKGWVDTTTNTFTIASWSDASGARWTPQANELPLVLLAYKQDGTAFDVPDNWDGQISGFAFFLPTDQDLRNVMWNQGTPDTFWKGTVLDGEGCGTLREK